MNKNYLCGYNINDTIQPIDGAMLAPFVVVKFQDIRNKASITVGNESNPPENTAAIKSFQYGLSNGHRAKIEIVDQEGGQFNQFANRIWKSIDNTSQDYVMYIQWGWITEYCGQKFSGRVNSPWITVLPLNLEIEYAEGVIKYILTATDLMQVVFNTRQDKHFGTDDAKIPLKQAIRDLASFEEPKFDVIFPKSDYASCPTDGEQKTEWSFAEFGCEGPSSAWTFDGQNKLVTINRWIGDYRTTSGKGLTTVWDNSKEKPTLAIIEDPKPINSDDKVEKPNDRMVIGSYIINGGGKSPVISFTPKMNWVGGLASMAGATGNSGSALSGETKKKTKTNSGIQNQNAGIAQSIPISKNAQEAFGPDRALGEVEKNQNLNAIANQSQLPGYFTPIEAELRIQGDPRSRYVLTVDALYKYVSLIVLNPHFISNSKNCGEWLARPSCNSVLTNKFWLITGIDHSIREGSYTTTINLKLPTPGIDFAGSDPLGGPGSGGPVFENAS